MYILCASPPPKKRKKEKEKTLLRTPNIHELLEMVGRGKNEYEEGKIYLLKKKKQKEKNLFNLFCC
jgi:hypothetical protein